MLILLLDGRWERAEATYESLRVQLDEKLLALEAEFAYLCPRERVDLVEALEDEYAHVGDSKVQCHSVMVLQHK